MIKRVIPAFIAALLIVGDVSVADDPTQTVAKTLYAYEDAWSHHDARLEDFLLGHPSARQRTALSLPGKHFARCAPQRPRNSAR